MAGAKDAAPLEWSLVKRNVVCPIRPREDPDEVFKRGVLDSAFFTLKSNSPLLAWHFLFVPTL